jgi:hypothetical protein
MKLLAASIIILLTLSASIAFTATPTETCSCTADDGTCSASVTCRGGCIAWCPTDGCVAQCLDNGDGSNRAGIMSQSVTLRLRGSNGREVSTELARITGEDVAFSASATGGTVDLDVENLPVWNVLEILSQSGRIQISGVDLSNIRRVRRTLLYGEPISVCAHGMTVKRFVNELRFMTGLNFQITAGDPNTIVNYNGRGVRLNDILTQVSERTGVQLAAK